MEWHGPHMAMGMDTCNAYYTALATAKVAGGVVFPPAYVGTETKRTPETLKKLGFNGDEDIIGMDFPDNEFKSMYWPVELFRQYVECQLDMICKMGFKNIVIMNGHGADAQIRIIKETVRSVNEKYQVKAEAILTLFDDCGYGVGHAGLVETSIMMALHSQAVDLSVLPERSETLHMKDYGIADNETFTIGPDAEYSVRYDPRDASAETGAQILDFNVKQCVRIVNRLLGRA